MNHGARTMSGNNPSDSVPDDANERELIDIEFQSMVENLSLDESAPTSYLDELEKFEDLDKFRAPHPPKIGLHESLKRAINSLKKWKNGPTHHDDDGVAI